MYSCNHYSASECLLNTQGTIENSEIFTKQRWRLRNAPIHSPSTSLQPWWQCAQAFWNSFKWTLTIQKKKTVTIAWVLWHIKWADCHMQKSSLWYSLYCWLASRVEKGKENSRILSSWEKRHLQLYKERSQMCFCGIKASKLKSKRHFTFVYH